jgi:hypothetical protein
MLICDSKREVVSMTDLPPPLRNRQQGDVDVSLPPPAAGKESQSLIWLRFFERRIRNLI